MSLLHRIATATVSWALSVCIILASGLAGARADEKRWRLFDQGNDAFLVVAETDQLDRPALPEFSCRKAIGFIDVYGEAKENLRMAMAERIRTGQAPWIQFVPDYSDKTTFVDLSFSHEGWRYKYSLIADHEAFERLKREGVLEFKLGTVLVHEEFTAGLDNVSKFLDLCNKGFYK